MSFCLWGISLDINAQLSAFPLTASGDCSGTTLNYTHVVNLSASGTTDVPSDVLLSFCLTGDYGSSTNGEGITVYGEGGTNLGFFNRDDSDNPGYADCDNTPMCFSITITQAQWNAWNNNGTVTIQIIPSTAVNFCTNYSCLGTVTADYLKGPGGITGNLSVWLKGDKGVYENNAASDIAEDGDDVYQWNDQSTGAYHAVDNGSNRPSYNSAGLNYNPTIDFNGSSDYLENTSGGLYPNEIYCVFIPNDPVSNSALPQIIVSSDGTGAGGADVFSLSFGSFTGAFGDEVITHGVGPATGWRSALVGNATYPAQYNFMITSRENAGSNGTDIYEAGRKVDNASSSTYQSVANQPFKIGRHFGTPTHYLSGRVAEIISYASRNNDVNKQIIESYLAVKYGITMGTPASPVNYVSSANSVIWSGDTEYQNNIIGIGRDDDGSLLQKQSHTRTDSTRIFTGTLSATNLSNASGQLTLSGDLSFVLIGDNQGSLNTTAAVSLNKPTGIFSRIEREWKVVNTNYDQSFSLDITLSGSASVSSIALSNLALLADSDNDFTDATVLTALNGLSFSLIGNTIRISGITTAHLPENSTRYITLASLSALTPLPVELLYFDAKLVGNSVEITWETVSEVNSSHFIVERSGDGLNWEYLDKIRAAGNSSIPVSYVTSDQKPFAGRSYYRLKQVDNDGTYWYSAVRTVTINEISGLSLYPNPAGDLLMVSSEGAVPSNIEIRNALGQVVPFRVMNWGNTTEIATDQLESGIYYLTVNNAVTMKFVKG